MTLAVIADTFEDALAEAYAYQIMDALDDKVLSEIAYSYNVNADDLMDALKDETRQP